MTTTYSFELFFFLMVGLLFAAFFYKSYYAKKHNVSEKLLNVLIIILFIVLFLGSIIFIEKTNKKSDLSQSISTHFGGESKRQEAHKSFVDKYFNIPFSF